MMVEKNQKVKRKKFKHKEVEQYMKGKGFSEWEGIKPAEKARGRIKVVANARDKRDFSIFSGFHFEPIESTKNHHSIRIGGKGRCFFIGEDDQAGEIDINDHDYKKVKR